MTPRTWRWLMAAALFATTLIALAGQIEIPFIDRIVKPREACEDRPECRAYIDQRIRDAIQDALERTDPRIRLRSHGSGDAGEPDVPNGAGGNDGAPPTSTSPSAPPPPGPGPGPGPDPNPDPGPKPGPGPEPGPDPPPGGGGEGGGQGGVGQQIGEAIDDVVGTIDDTAGGAVCANAPALCPRRPQH